MVLEPARKKKVSSDATLLFIYEFRKLPKKFVNLFVTLKYILYFRPIKAIKRRVKTEIK